MTPVLSVVDDPAVVEARENLRSAFDARRQHRIEQHLGVGDVVIGIP
jgi:hypothetical protein